MRKIVDNWLYDTEVASNIAERRGGDPETDPKWYQEAPYVTEHGRWFMHINGGPESRYAEGEDITIVTSDQAFEWLATHAELEGLERYFPGRVEPA